MNTIDLSPTQTILYNEVYAYSLLKTEGNIIVGSVSGLAGWTDKCKFEPTGNGYFAGTLTTVGDITSNTGNITSSIGKYISIREYRVIQRKHHSTMGNHQRAKCNINWKHNGTR
ncbi:MAG: hypothetical protein ACKPKO_24885, partial [Candidatus Fonsibacter sp.]